MTLDMSNTGSKLRKSFYARPTRGIAILPPSANKSAVDFEPEGGDIRYALAALKNMDRRPPPTSSRSAGQAVSRSFRLHVAGQSEGREQARDRTLTRRARLRIWRKTGPRLRRTLSALSSSPRGSPRTARRGRWTSSAVAARPASKPPIRSFWSDAPAGPP